MNLPPWTLSDPRRAHDSRSPHVHIGPSGSRMPDDGHDRASDYDDGTFAPKGRAMRRYRSPSNVLVREAPTTN